MAKNYLKPGEDSIYPSAKADIRAKVGVFTNGVAHVVGGPHPYIWIGTHDRCAATLEPKAVAILYQQLRHNEMTRSAKRKAKANSR